MSIVANKYKNIRCVSCYNEETAKLAKLHNNTNILAIGADQNTIDEAINIINVWINTEFEGERHKARIKMIEDIEKENMK